MAADPLSLAGSLAVVTSASSGTGYSLALLATRDGYDLITAVDSPDIQDAAAALRSTCRSVDALLVDLSTLGSPDALARRQSSLHEAIGDVQHVLDANVIGTIQLLQRIARGIRDRRAASAFSLRAELRDSGMALTCVMPGMTETNLFERADSGDLGTTPVRHEALLRGSVAVLESWKKKLAAAVTAVTPTAVFADLQQGAQGSWPSFRAMAS